MEGARPASFVYFNLFLREEGICIVYLNFGEWGVVARGVFFEKSSR